MICVFIHGGMSGVCREKVVLVMVKAIKNPRSALCKTSIMASSDIFNAFGETLLESASDAFSQLVQNHTFNNQSLMFYVP